MTTACTIGVFGGGQLARMLAMAAARLGISVHVYTDRADDCALAVTRQSQIGDYDDLAAIQRFAENCDVLTYEFENIPVASMRDAARIRPVYPDPAALEYAQDRLREKTFARELGIPVTPFEPFAASRWNEIAQELGLPMIIKSRRMGYDGKGQYWINPGVELPPEVRDASDDAYIAEARIAFATECSAIGARSVEGEIELYPVTENTHHQGILARSVAPSRNVPPETQRLAQDYLKRLLEQMAYVGVLTAEFFMLADGSLMFNEIAPRVHNSGHWTELGCTVSQFENHIRAISGLPLAPPDLRGAVEMTNLIGQDGMELGHRALSDPRSMVHFYGKHQVRPGRKLGHVTRWSEN